MSESPDEKRARLQRELDALDGVEGPPLPGGELFAERRPARRRTREQGREVEVQLFGARAGGTPPAASSERIVDGHDASSSTCCCAIATAATCSIGAAAFSRQADRGRRRTPETDRVVASRTRRPKRAACPAWRVRVAVAPVRGTNAGRVCRRASSTIHPLLVDGGGDYRAAQSPSEVGAFYSAHEISWAGRRRIAARGRSSAGSRLKRLESREAALPEPGAAAGFFVAAAPRRNPVVPAVANGLVLWDFDDGPFERSRAARARRSCRATRGG